MQDHATPGRDSEGRMEIFLTDVPERRGVAETAVLHGNAVFHALNYVGSHTPKHVTHRLQDRPEQSFQLI